MTPEEAKAVLLATVEPCHGQGEPTTFLGALRPYRGRLPEKPFHEIMSALRVLGPAWSRDARIDREVVSALWSITDLTRLWALEDGSMLRRNQLITDVDLALLRRWHHMIAYAVANFLEADDEREAFSEYDAYVRDEVASLRSDVTR